MKKYLFVFLILSATSANAGLNKWVDEQGKVHYSDQPPVGVEASTLRNAPPPASASAPTKSFSEREAELKKARKSQREASEKTAQDQSDAEANCTTAKKTYYSLQQGGRLVEYDKNGEQRFLEDEERQRRTEKAQAEIEKWCK